MISRCRAFVLGAALALLLAPASARAQETDTTRAPAEDSARGPRRPPPAMPTELPSLEGRPSARGAMIRSFILPGWGQASYDRYTRGGVYFMGHLGNGFMIFKTLTSLDEAQDREDRWVQVTRDSLVTAGAPADSIDALIDADADVLHVRRLVSAREEQREDWIALGVFWMLISGVDAYVTAQLADFPASIGAVIDGRRVGVVVTVPAR